MGYAIELSYGDNVAIVPLHTEGSTYAMGGIREAAICITYNYSRFFRATLDADKGLRWLYGKTGAETIKRLMAAVEALGADPYRGPYYVSTLQAMNLRHDFGDLDLNAPENLTRVKALIAVGLVEDGGSYWRPVPGNAGYALSILLAWARQHPAAEWQGD